MADVASIEHVYERVQLVPGKGDRRTGRLCIMSFVALLAGEGHTDAPATASPFIRHYALTLNDGLPETERQRLKLFAPRILGTNDGLDAERLRLMLNVFAEEIAPHLQTDLAAGRLPISLTCDWSSCDLKNAKSLQELTFAFFANADQLVAPPHKNHSATAAAKLLIMCAKSASRIDSGGWYWSKAIDLLDRFCDVRPPMPRSFLTPAQVDHADKLLSHKDAVCAACKTVHELLSRAGRTFRKCLAAFGSGGASAKPQLGGSSEIAPTVPGQATVSVSAQSRTLTVK
jgi:hypothetical protein